MKGVDGNRTDTTNRVSRRNVPILQNLTDFTNIQLLAADDIAIRLAMSSTLPKMLRDSRRQDDTAPCPLQLVSELRILHIRQIVLIGMIKSFDTLLVTTLVLPDTHISIYDRQETGQN